MGKQRSLSFPWKLARFLLLSLTLSFCFALISFFSFWATHSPSNPIHQQSFSLLNMPSLTFTVNPINLQSFTTPLPDSHYNRTNSTHTHLGKPRNSFGFRNSGENLSLGNNRLRKTLNSSGSVKSSVSDIGNPSAIEDGIKKEKEPNFVLIGKIDLEIENRGVKDCDVSKGKWVFDESYPLYTNFSCPFIDEGFNCQGNGRHDADYMKWRWQPQDCDIPRNANVEGIRGYIREDRILDFRMRVRVASTEDKLSEIDLGDLDESEKIVILRGKHRMGRPKKSWTWTYVRSHCGQMFNATNMLELIRGKRLVFAGDSINRNQWESLLCLLMGAVQDPSKVYETRGRRITKQRGTYSFRFVDYQCTVEFYVTHFLVHESKARIGKKRKEILRLDSIHKGSSRWKGADILIFNTGNWWSHVKTKAGINYYQEGKQVHPHLDALTAYRKALTTWATWVDTHINPRKTHVFFRSTSPAHFSGGQWNTGGRCRQARKPLEEVYIDHPDKDMISLEVISKMKVAVTFLDVNGLSSYRIDGHPSKYGRSPGIKGSSVEDCSHWCLPGVPDVWNQLIYNRLFLNQKKNE